MKKCVQSSWGKRGLDAFKLDNVCQNTSNQHKTPKTKTKQTKRPKKKKKQQNQKQKIIRTTSSISEDKTFSEHISHRKRYIQNI